MNILHVSLLVCVACHVLASKKPALGKRKPPARLTERREAITKRPKVRRSTRTVQKKGMNALEGDIANSPKARKFKRAVKGNDVATARSIFFIGNPELKEYCGKYLTNLRQPKLIKLCKVENDQAFMAWILRIIFLHAGLKFIDSFLKKLKPDDHDVSRAMKDTDLACNTERFTNALKKIVDKSEQINAVGHGVSAMTVNNKVEHFDPLLTALKEDASFGKDLIDTAISQMFMSASYRKDGRALYAKDFFDYPAVSAIDYSFALLVSYKYGGPTKELFYWLLERADRQDLGETLKVKDFSRESPEFREVIAKALATVSTETRYERGKRERDETTALAMDTLAHVPTALINVILGYYFGW